MNTFKAVLFFLFCATWGTVSCKKPVDTSVDKQTYFNINPQIQDKLKTRAEVCNSVPTQQFNNQTEECVNLVTVCTQQKFHVWDYTSNTCVQSQQLIDEYNQQKCASLGKIVGSQGTCISAPPSSTDTSSGI